MWSSTIAIETDGLIAMPPAVPALSSVSTTWRCVAVMSSLPPPVKLAPARTAARTRLSVRMLRPTEAPMPTLPAFASESAFAVSASLLCARELHVAAGAR